MILDNTSAATFTIDGSTITGANTGSIVFAPNGISIYSGDYLIGQRKIDMGDTRFRFANEIPTVTDDIRVSGQPIGAFDDDKLVLIASAMKVLNDAAQDLFKKDLKNGAKTYPQVIELIQKEFARREEAAIDREIEEAQRIVDANKTQEMRLAEATAALEKALAKKAARAS